MTHHLFILNAWLIGCVNVTGFFVPIKLFPGTIDITMSTKTGNSRNLEQCALD